MSNKNEQIKQTVTKLKKELGKHGLVKNMSTMKKLDLINIQDKVQNYLKKKEEYDYHKYDFNGNIISINSEQYNVVTEDIGKNIRIVACAGSGKTTTIVCRIKYLIDHGQLPERIMLTTFNVDAAHSMRNKIESLFGFMPNITVGTIDSISCRLWNKYFKKHSFIGVSEYSTELLTFLQTSPNKEKVLGMYDYIFFDEFQDCNQIQFEIVREFVSYGAKLTVIGDDAQNIYQWRGSNIDFILNLNKYVPNLVTHKLVNNYRSTPEIVSFANTSIRYNSDQIPKEMIANNKSIDFLPTVIQFDSDEEQCSQIIGMILNFVDQGIKYDQIAVLSRNNFPLKMLEEQIVKLNANKTKQNIQLNPESRQQDPKFTLDKQKQKQSVGIEQYYDCEEETSQSHSEENTDKIPYIALITEDGADTKPKIAAGHMTLTTIHKSKGLEWDVVFLIGTNDKIFPSEINTISIQEERRLFYVAVTRPKKYLYITFTKNSVSRFVAEVPFDFFKFDNFKESYFEYDNFRGLKFDTGVTKLLQLLNEMDYKHFREAGIIPDLTPTITKIHGEHSFHKHIDKYYLHPDFGEFIDRYITRNIGKLNAASGGLLDRSAEIVIASVSLGRSDFDVYKKYETNFKLNVGKINQSTKQYQYINIISKVNAKFDKITRKIESRDIGTLTKIISAIVKGAKEHNKKTSEIVVIPFNYLPPELKHLMKNSYNDYKNKNKKTNSVCYQLYQVSLCSNILADRRRLLYKDVFDKFTYDTQLFADIKKYTATIKDNDLICKKYVFDEIRSIEGEIDLLNITDKEIIDFKASKDINCKLEWLLQLLTYYSLLKIEQYDNTNNIIAPIEIKYLTIYNPLQGNVYKFDITGWDKYDELLSYLDYVRLRQLSRTKLNYNQFEYGSHVFQLDFDLNKDNEDNQDNDNDNEDNQDNQDIETNVNQTNNLLIDSSNTSFISNGCGNDNTNSSCKNDKNIINNFKIDNLIDLEQNTDHSNQKLNKKYMVIDTETTGLPKTKKNSYYEYSDTEKYDSSRVVQISWLIIDSNLKTETIKDYIVKVEPERNLKNTYGTSLHGISDLISDMLGIPIDDVCNELLADLKKVDYIVGHNIDFDLNVLKSEMFRYDKNEIIFELETKNVICTMKEMEKRLGKGRPSLAECYSKLYGKMMTGAHNSKYDIIYTSKVLEKILKQN